MSVLSKIRVLLPRRSFLSCFVATAAGFFWMLLACSTAFGVILSAGNDSSTNLTAASLFSATGAGGPGDPSAPGFNNVGVSSTGNASITYLSNGWAITAAHVTVSGSVQFNSVNYTVGETVQLGSADLQMVHLSSANPYPNLPAITSAQISTSAPTGQVTMIGNGLNSGPQLYWSVNVIPSPWQWTATGAPSGPPPVGVLDLSGFDPAGGHQIRWGQNTAVSGPDVIAPGGSQYQTEAFKTQFASTGNDAAASNGDSGGAAFSLVNGSWQLSGIMLAYDTQTYSGEAAGTELFGDYTYLADLSQYSSQIAATLAIVPEPASMGLALSAATLLGLYALRRRRARMN